MPWRPAGIDGGQGPRCGSNQAPPAVGHRAIHAKGAPVKQSGQVGFQPIDQEAGFQLEQKVDWIVSLGRIIIQPTEKVAYDLDALINGINAPNAHDEVSFGSPAGNVAR